jgi:hypothetical protein
MIIFVFSLERILKDLKECLRCCLCGPLPPTPLPGSLLRMPGVKPKPLLAKDLGNLPPPRGLEGLSPSSPLSVSLRSVFP